MKIKTGFLTVASLLAAFAVAETATLEPETRSRRLGSLRRVDRAPHADR